MPIPSKDINFGSDARQKIMAGAEKLARAVGTTLGPKGRNVALASRYGGAIVVHDGVTVAREIRLSDPQEDIGAVILREAASKTNDASGDGTTTATVLAFDIAREGLIHVVAGVNPMLIKKGIDHATKQAVEALEKMAEPIKNSLEKMIQVATISAADADIGKTIAEALNKVGEYGVVTAEQGTELGYTTEFKEGMEWDKGWLLPHFVPQILDGKINFRMEAVIKNPYVLVTDHTITSVREIAPFLEKFVAAGKKDLLIISDGIEREALAILITNFQRGLLNVLAVPAPSFGEHKRDGLEDIAILTGGTFISKEMGRKVEDVKIEELGQADEVTATRESTIVVGGKGKKEDIINRGKQIEEQLKDAKHEYLKERYKERLAKLTSGVAVVKVGTSSDTENREKIERVKDAIGATKAAVEEGIVPGGGVALLHVASKLAATKDMTKEEAVGVEILKRALQKPIKLLAENAGINGDVVAAEIVKHPFGMGYNVVTGEYGNMKDLGILDPVKVTISALQNASSVAGMILTTEAMVTDHPEPEKEKKEQS